MGNILAGTISQTSGQTPFKYNSSEITYNGTNLSNIGFVANGAMNTSFSNLDTIIADIVTNTANIVTNTADILTNTNAIAALAIPDIDYNGTITGAIYDAVDLTGDTTLEDVLKSMLAEIKIHDTAIANLSSPSDGSPDNINTYSLEPIIRDHISSGLTTISTSLLTATIDDGVAYVDAKRLDVAQATLTFPASKDNYVDLNYDGTYTTTSVTNGAAPPSIAATAMRMFKYVTNGTVVTSTTVYAETWPFTGAQIKDNTITATQLNLTGVSAATYQLSRLTVTTDGRITSAIEITGTTNKYLRIHSDLTWIANGIITDNTSAVGFNLTNYQKLVNLPAGEALHFELGVPTGVSAIAVTGGTLVDDTYYYVVTAFNQTGESSKSAEVNATTSGTDNTVTIAWSALIGATSYRVYQGTVSGTYTQYFTVDAPTVTLDDDGTAGTGGTPPAVTTGSSILLLSQGISYLGSTYFSGDLLSAIANTSSIGSATYPFKDIFIGSAATYFHIDLSTSLDLDVIGGIPLQIQITGTKYQEFNRASNFPVEFYKKVTIWEDASNLESQLQINGTTAIAKFLIGAGVDFTNEEAYFSAINTPFHIATGVTGNTVALSVDNSQAVWAHSNFGVGITTSGFGTNADKTLGLFIGTAPSTSPADTVQFYVQDQTGAGTATCWIRNENTDVIKLYKRSE